MGLEAVSFPDDLVITNPVAGDPRSEGDDHLRNLKTAVKAAFPGLAGRAWRAQTKTINYTVLTTDNMSLFNIATTSITLAGTAAATLGSGHLFLIHANGFDVTFDPNSSELVNGVATMVVPNGALALVFCNGTGFVASIIPLGIGVQTFTTGDVKLSIKTVADLGWVLMDDKTIGNAASGATGRANADTVDLFTLLWNNTADAQCAVSSGRGASAAADYAANKTIALPLALGRTLATYGTGSGLTARVLAKTIGSEDAINVAHTHTGTTGGQSATHTHNSTVGASGAGATGAQPDNDGTSSAQTGAASNDHTHAFTTDSSGASGTGANMQPTLFLNTMIKL